MKFPEHANPLERNLRAMPRATETPDLTASILAHVNEHRPFVDSPTRRLRRWARVIASGLALGVVVCGATAVLYAPDLIPGLRPHARPVSTVLAGLAADTDASATQLREAPGRLLELASSVGRDTTTFDAVRPRPTRAQDPVVRRVVAMYQGAERRVIQWRPMAATPMQSEWSFSDHLERAAWGRPVEGTFTLERAVYLGPQ